MQHPQLSCVGIGMLLGGHISARARAAIEQAEVVYGAVSDGIVELWLRELNPAYRSLQVHYVEGRSRLIGYQAMVDELLDAAQRGLRVCAAFYGHPAVFAWVPHATVTQARALGLSAAIEPGISAEDCLYADLGIDPGTFGVQHYEATQLMLYRRRIDASAYLIVWQIGVAGDRGLTRFSTPAAYRALLIEVLLRDYPADHPLILYRAATLPFEQTHIVNVRLDQLANVAVTAADTLVVPPYLALQHDHAIRAKLDALDHDLG